jgi:hypothetical protein
MLDIGPELPWGMPGMGPAGDGAEQPARPREAAKAAAITVKRILVFIESVLQNVGGTAVGWYGTVPVYVRLMDKSQGVGLRGV